MSTTDLGSVLNAAIQGGYVAYLDPGTYTITQPIVIHVTSTTQGPLGLDGGGATIISQIANDQPAIQIVVDDVGVDLRYLTLSNFTLQGSGHEGDGISIVAPSNDSWVYNWNISDVTVQGVGGYGLDIQGSVFEGVVSNTSMIDNGKGGACFGHSSVGGQTSALRWFGGEIDGNGGAGITLGNGARDLSVDGVSFTGNAGAGVSAEWGITSVTASTFTDNQGAGIWFQNFGHFNDNTFVSSGAQDVGISGWLNGNATLIGNHSSATPGSSETPVLANIQGYGGLFTADDSGPVLTGTHVAVSGEGGGNLAQVAVSVFGVALPTLDAVSTTIVAVPAGTVPGVLDGVLHQAIAGGTVTQVENVTDYTVGSTITITITSSSQAAAGIDLGGAKIHSQVSGGAPVIQIVIAAGVDVGNLVLSNFSILGNGTEGDGIRIISAASGSAVSLDMRNVNVEHVGGVGLDLIGNVSGTVFDSWMHGNLEGGARIAAAVDGGVTGDIDWIGGGFRKNGVAGLILDNGAHSVEVKGAYIVENQGPGIIATAGIDLVRNSGFENNAGVGALVEGTSRFVDTTFSTHSVQQVAVGGVLSGDTVTLIGVSNEYYGSGADTTVLANLQGSGTLGIAGGGKVVAGPGVSVTGADTTAPIATAIAVSGTGVTAGAGTLAAGATVTLTMALSEAVTVSGGTPTLVLNDGGTATYTGGSGTATLTFSHTVQAGQNAADLAVSSLNLNGAAIKDAAGNAADLAAVTSYNPAGVLKIDAVAPTVTAIAASGTGISAGAGTLNAGKVVTLTMTLSEAVTVAGGTPVLVLSDGGTATYTGGSGTATLTFSHTVQAGQNAADLAVSSLSLNGATIKDAAGNTANLAAATNYNPTGTLNIDTASPTVTSIAASGTGISAGSGTLDAGKVVTLTMTLSEAVSVTGGTPTLVLNDGGTATYTGGSGTATLTFSHTVQTGQNVADLAVSSLSLNGASITDAAGNAANLAAATNYNPAGTLKIDTLPVVTQQLVADTGSSASDAITSHVELTGTAPANAVVSFTIDGQATGKTVTADASGHWSFTPTGLADGQHAIVASVSAGGGASNTLTVTLDSHAPVPVVTDAVFANGQVTLSGTTGSASDAVWIYDGNNWLGGTTSNAQGQWSFTANADAAAAHSYGLISTDLAGNTGRSAQPFVPGTSTPTPPPPTTPVVDTVAPVPIILSAVIVDGHLTISGTAGEAGATVSIYDGYSWLGTATSSGTQGQWTFSADADPDAAHSYGVNAIDLAGNEGHGTQHVVPVIGPAVVEAPPPPAPVVDTTPPVPTFTGVAIVDTKVTLSGTTGSAGDTVSVYDGNNWLGFATSDANGAWSHKANADPNAVHSYGINATDAAGNEGKGTGVAIVGSVGADTLVGTAGNDVIAGHGGADVMSGGAGQDSFVFTAAGKATVNDFQQGADKIDFAALNSAHDLQVQGAMTGTATLGAHSVGWIDTAAGTLLLVNTSAVAESVSAAAPQNAEVQVTLLGVHNLAATDLHLT